MNTNLKTVIIETTKYEGFQVADREPTWAEGLRSFGFWDKCVTKLVHFNGRFYLESGALSVEVPASSVVREIFDEGRLGDWRTVAEILEEKEQDAAAQI